MNNVFKCYLKKFMLVFFGDILIYNPDMKTHLQHLRKVFTAMREQDLYAKMNKYSFAQSQTKYLGHIISHECLKTDSPKLETVKNWPKPKTAKEMRGFLDLIGYYRRFVRGYGIISRPLTNMLKKHSFEWSKEAGLTFAKLNEALYTAPMLALPDFTLEFTIEAYACFQGMRVVLM